MENIRTIRVLKRISQWEMARLTGIAQSKISLFENGYLNPKFEELKKIAMVLDVVPHQLVGSESGNEGQKTGATELRKYLKEKLPEYMIPSAFVLLEALPLTPNGKVDRRALPAPERSGLEKGYVAPRTHTEEVLTKIWTEVLGLKQVGIHDNFFELGGHSLLATQLISRTHKEFQVDIPVHKLFEEPTVATLAEYIETIQWLAQEPSISSDVTESKREEIEI